MSRRRNPDTKGRYLERLDIDTSCVEDWTVYPFHLPFVRKLGLEFRSPLTFFIGENGSGKSTSVAHELSARADAAGTVPVFPQSHLFAVPIAVPIVVSQDGGVRFVANRDAEVLFWDHSVSP